MQSQTKVIMAQKPLPMAQKPLQQKILLDSQKSPLQTNSLNVKIVPTSWETWFGSSQQGFVPPMPPLLKELWVEMITLFNDPEKAIQIANQWYLDYVETVTGVFPRPPDQDWYDVPNATLSKTQLSTFYNYLLFLTANGTLLYYTNNEPPPSPPKWKTEVEPLFASSLSSYPPMLKKVPFPDVYYAILSYYFSNFPQIQSYLFKDIYNLLTYILSQNHFPPKWLGSWMILLLFYFLVLKDKSVSQLQSHVKWLESLSQSDKFDKFQKFQKLRELWKFQKQKLFSPPKPPKSKQRLAEALRFLDGRKEKQDMSTQQRKQGQQLAMAVGRELEEREKRFQQGDVSQQLSPEERQFLQKLSPFQKLYYQRSVATTSQGKQQKLPSLSSLLDSDSPTPDIVKQKLATLSSSEQLALLKKIDSILVKIFPVSEWKEKEQIEFLQFLQFYYTLLFHLVKSYDWNKDASSLQTFSKSLKSLLTQQNLVNTKRQIQQLASRSTLFPTLFFTQETSEPFHHFSFSDIQRLQQWGYISPTASSLLPSLLPRLVTLFSSWYNSPSTHFQKEKWNTFVLKKLEAFSQLYFNMLQNLNKMQTIPSSQKDQKKVSSFFRSDIIPTMQRTHTIPSPQTTMKMYNLLSSSSSQPTEKGEHWHKWTSWKKWLKGVPSDARQIFESVRDAVNTNPAYLSSQESVKDRIALQTMQSLFTISEKDIPTLQRLWESKKSVLLPYLRTTPIFQSSLFTKLLSPFSESQTSENKDIVFSFEMHSYPTRSQKQDDNSTGASCRYYVMRPTPFQTGDSVEVVENPTCEEKNMKMGLPTKYLLFSIPILQQTSQLVKKHIVMYIGISRQRFFIRILIIDSTTTDKENSQHSSKNLPTIEDMQKKGVLVLSLPIQLCSKEAWNSLNIADEISLEKIVRNNITTKKWIDQRLSITLTIILYYVPYFLPLILPLAFPVVSPEEANRIGWDIRMESLHLYPASTDVVIKLYQQLFGWAVPSSLVSNTANTVNAVMKAFSSTVRWGLRKVSQKGLLSLSGVTDRFLGLLDAVPGLKQLVVTLVRFLFTSCFPPLSWTPHNFFPAPPPLPKTTKLSFRSRFLDTASGWFHPFVGSRKILEHVDPKVLEEAGITRVRAPSLERPILFSKSQIRQLEQAKLKLEKQSITSVDAYRFALSFHNFHGDGIKKLYYTLGVTKTLVTLKNQQIYSVPITVFDKEKEIASVVTLFLSTKVTPPSLQTIAPPPVCAEDKQDTKSRCKNIKNIKNNQPTTTLASDLILEIVVAHGDTQSTIYESFILKTQEMIPFAFRLPLAGLFQPMTPELFQQFTFSPTPLPAVESVGKILQGAINRKLLHPRNAFRFMKTIQEKMSTPFAIFTLLSQIFQHLHEYVYLLLPMTFCRSSKSSCINNVFGIHLEQFHNDNILSAKISSLLGIYTESTSLTVESVTWIVKNVLKALGIYRLLLGIVYLLFTQIAV